jgi:hypothetical protein
MEMYFLRSCDSCDTATIRGFSLSNCLKLFLRQRSDRVRQAKSVAISRFAVASSRSCAFLYGKWSICRNVAVVAGHQNMRTGEIHDNA